MIADDESIRFQASKTACLSILLFKGLEWCIRILLVVSQEGTLHFAKMSKTSPPELNCAKIWRGGEKGGEASRS